MTLLLQRSRTDPTLPESLNHRLNSYALAAGAAGVSLLAMNQLAEAEVVFTPTSVVIPANSSYLLDLNHDGTPDFKIQQSTTSFTALLSVHTQFDYKNAIQLDSHAQAAALNQGSRIGSGNDFYGCVTCSFGETMAIANRGGDYGPWVNVSKRFLGFRFNFHHELHYGWARLSVRAEGFSIKALLTGYAYETIAKKAIRAGQTLETADTSASDETPTDPSSLGALAQGSQGLQRRRRLHQQ
jgi:hypothetical protein